MKHNSHTIDILRTNILIKDNHDNKYDKKKQNKTWSTLNSQNVFHCRFGIYDRGMIGYWQCPVYLSYTSFVAGTDPRFNNKKKHLNCTPGVCFHVGE